MKQIVCEMCGSNDLVKKDGKYVCQHCGTQYDAEEAKKLLVEVDNSKQTENLFLLARRERDLGNYVKAKEYYDQILVEKPTDWEASFFSLLGNAYGITRGEVPTAVANLVKSIPVAIDIMVKSTDDVEERLKNLDIIVENTVATYTYLKANKVSTSIEDIRSFGRIVVACVSDMGYKIKNLGETGMLGDEQQWKPIVAKAFRWRTEFALSAPAMFDETVRNKYADELVEVDPTFKKPEIKASPACYVATAVYGSYDCPEVWTLRRFRDYSLAETWYGRVFVHTYYAISPTLVKWFGDTAWFKSLWRGTLDRMVNNLNSKGYEATPYQDREW